MAGYCFGTFVSFNLNRVVTFKAKDKPRMRFVLFFAVAGVGYSVSAAMLWILVERFFFDSNLAKLLTLPVVVALQFTLNKLITFRPVGVAAT